MGTCLKACEGSLVISVIQMGKLRLREVKQLTLGHNVKWLNLTLLSCPLLLNPECLKGGIIEWLRAWGWVWNPKYLGLVPAL